MRASGACDIDHDGVDFCAATFGATPVYGHEDPADIEIDAPYELIWCGSLFTHLPPERWDGFLACSSARSRPGACVVFTTHGRRIAERIRDPETGRVYLNPIDHDAAAERLRAGGGRVRANTRTRPSTARRPSLPRDLRDLAGAPSVVCAMVERRPQLQLVGFTEGRFNGQDLVSAVRRPAGGRSGESNAR